MGSVKRFAPQPGPCLRPPSSHTIEGEVAEEGGQEVHDVHDSDGQVGDTLHLPLGGTTGGWGAGEGLGAKLGYTGRSLRALGSFWHHTLTMCSKEASFLPPVVTHSCYGDL